MKQDFWLIKEKEKKHVVLATLSRLSTMTNASLLKAQGDDTLTFKEKKKKNKVNILNTRHWDKSLKPASERT